jgi:hypothetical protein
LLEPVTVEVNCCVWPVCTVAKFGATNTDNPESELAGTGKQPSSKASSKERVAGAHFFENVRSRRFRAPFNRLFIPSGSNIETRLVLERATDAERVEYLFWKTARCHHGAM